MPKKDERDSGGDNPQVAGEAAKDSREPGPTDTATQVASDGDLIKRNLTEEEAFGILLEHAKRREAEKGAAAAKEVEEQARLERRAAPMNFVGLDLGHNGEYVYVRLDHPPIAPERTVHLYGVTYEHVHTDSDGVWLYRHLG